MITATLSPYEATLPRIEEIVTMPIYANGSRVDKDIFYKKWSDSKVGEKKIAIIKMVFPDGDAVTIGQKELSRKFYK